MHLKMKTLIPIIIILISSLSLKFDSDKLVGKWQCYHKEQEDGTTKSISLFSGEEFEYSCDGLIIDLKSDGTGWESQGKLTFKYRLIDSVLNMGNRYYIVELLSEKELILRDYDPDDIALFNYRSKFKRME